MAREKLFLTHVLVWAIFILYEVTLIHVALGLPTLLLPTFIFYIINIALFYCNAHLVLDFAFFRLKRNYIAAIFLIIIELSIYFILKCGLDRLISMFSGKPVLFTKRYVLVNLWRGIYFIGLSAVYWFMRYTKKLRERNYLVEKEQLIARSNNLELNNRLITVENAYLQNQISPHLLFNSLNFIYNTVYRTSDKAGNGVLRLSDLMRYSLRTVDDTKEVMVSEELKQIQNLIELCRLRFGDEFYLTFIKKGALKKKKIIPMVLITLVENIMKHGDIGDKLHPVRISVVATEDRFQFSTSNRNRNHDLFRKNGLGIANIRKRLANFYPEKYTLDIRQENELFKTELIIML